MVRGAWPRIHPRGLVDIHSRVSACLWRRKRPSVELKGSCSYATCKSKRRPLAIASIVLLSGCDLFFLFPLFFLLCSLYRSFLLIALLSFRKPEVSICFDHCLWSLLYFKDNTCLIIVFIWLFAEILLDFQAPCELTKWLYRIV